VVAADVFRAGQVRNRARHFQDPVIGPRAQIQIRHGEFQQFLLAFILRAKTFQLPRPHARVAGDGGRNKATVLLMMQVQPSSRIGRQRFNQPLS
jgi:hypothetical protein